MNDRDNAQRVPPPLPAPTDKEQGEVPSDQTAQERGERIESGKAIARGGRKKGHVPGATPSPDQQKGVHHGEPL